MIIVFTRKTEGWNPAGGLETHLSFFPQLLPVCISSTSYMKGITMYFDLCYFKTR